MRREGPALNPGVNRHGGTSQNHHSMDVHLMWEYVRIEVAMIRICSKGGYPVPQCVCGPTKASTLQAVQLPPPVTQACIPVTAGSPHNI